MPRHARATAARRRALRSFFTAAGTGSSPAVRVPGRGEYGNTCTFVIPASRTTRSVFANARSSSAGKPTITSVVRLKSSRAARAAAGTSRRCSGGPSRAARRRHPTGAGRAGGARRSASRAAPRRARRDVVDLDRREPQPREPRRRAGLADEPRERVAGLAVAKAAEVDAGQHDLAVPLGDAPADLARTARRERLRCRRGRAGSRRSCTRRSSRPGSSRTPGRGRAARRPARSRSRRHRPRPPGGLLAAARERRRRSRGRPANASPSRLAPQPVT